MECKVNGTILCKARIKRYDEIKIVRTGASARGEYLSDWQCDGGFYHDESTIEIDYDTIELIAPNEYEIVTATGSYEGNSEIVEILEIYDDNFELIDYV